MANDTLTLNSGSGGSELAGDLNASSEFYQRMKLVDGTDDSDTIVACANGTNGNALRVTVASDSTGQIKLAAGTASVGTVNLGTWATAATTSPVTLEDTASAGGDAMMKIAARRTASPADTSGADGDYESIQIDNGKVWVQAGGSVAHDGALGSNDNPILNGGVACEMDGTTLSAAAVAEGDITYIRTDRDGRQLVSTAHPASDTYTLESSSAQTATVVKAAPGAGFRIVIEAIQMSALTAQTGWLHDEDDNLLFPLQYFGANTGIVSINNLDIRLPVNKALEVTTTAAVAHSVFVQYRVTAG